MKICNVTGMTLCLRCNGTPPTQHGKSCGDVCRKKVEKIMGYLASGNIYRFHDGKLYEIDADVIDETECDIS